MEYRISNIPTKQNVFNILSVGICIEGPFINNQQQYPNNNDMTDTNAIQRRMASAISKCIDDIQKMHIIHMKNVG